MTLMLEASKNEIRAVPPHDVVLASWSTFRSCQQRAHNQQIYCSTRNEDDQLGQTSQECAKFIWFIYIYIYLYSMHIYIYMFLPVVFSPVISIGSHWELAHLLFDPLSQFHLDSVNVAPSGSLWEIGNLVGGWPTPLRNISQLGWVFPIYGKIKNVPNHQPV